MINPGTGIRRGFLAMMITTFAGAQWSTSPDSNLQIGYGYDPQIVSDGSGGAFVIWTTDGHIHAQKLERFGYVQWADELPDGGVYVAYFIGCYWWDPSQAELTAKVQHIGADGSRLWGDAGGIEPLVDPAYSTFPLGLIPDGSGGVYVVYHHNDYESARVRETYVQHLDYDGNLLWGETGIYLASTRLVYRLKDDGQGGLIINYGSSRIQRLDSLGNKLWGDDGVMIPSGAFDIAVDHVSQSIYVHNSGGIVRVNKLALTDGNLLWDSTGVVIDTISINSIVYDLEVDSEGYCWISWNKSPGASYMQRVSPEGDIVFPRPGIQPGSLESQTGRILLERSNPSSVIILWSDNRNGDFNYFAQRKDLWGANLWNNDVLFSRSGGKAIITDGNGGLISAWYNLSDFGIYCPQVSVNGNLGEVLLSTDSGDGDILPGQFQLHQNYPNPFNPVTTIVFDIPELSDVRLIIYDLLGREVKELLNTHLNGGVHSITWDGKDNFGMDLSSGMYFYRLDAVSKETGKRFQETRKMVLLR